MNKSQWMKTILNNEDALIRSRPMVEWLKLPFELKEHKGMMSMMKKNQVLGIAVLSCILGFTGCQQQQGTIEHIEVEEEPVTVLLDLDGDGNGLYDPVERKEMLDVFLQETPELQNAINRGALPVAAAANENYLDFADYGNGEAELATKDAVYPHQEFDFDGDGQVTIEEQERDWPTLSLLVPRRIIESENKIPWGIDIFPEWISSAYFQEDVAEGEVVQQVARGLIRYNANQISPSYRPHKLSDNGGVEFAANSGQRLEIKGLRDARWDYRWGIMTFRIDGESGSGNSTVLLDINKGNGVFKSSPKIWYDKTTGLNIQYVGGQEGGGLDRRIMTTDNIIADGESWNVVVFGTRYGQMYASVNGVALETATPQPPRFSAGEVYDTKSYIGGEEMDNCAWAYDALVLGQTEPSQAMVQKLTGWAAHRLDFESRLPADHPYVNQRPVLDGEDFPDRFVHNDPKWNAWGEVVNNKELAKVHQGEPRVEAEGFERVFYDDFRAKRLGDSRAGTGDLWMGPGFNTAVGAKARLATPGKGVDVYGYDAEKQQQKLSLIRQGKNWWASALYTVNDQGQGYTWAGPKVFRIRFRFDKLDPKKVPPGLFPAFWSYGTENLWWRTANRIELDWFEFDGKNGYWFNGFSSHYHYPYHRGENNIFAKNTKSHKRFKIYSGELKPEKSKMPIDIFAWDGEFRTWEFVIDEDMTYANIAIPDGNGGEKWIEISRAPTPDVYLEEVDLQLDYALKTFEGMEGIDQLDFVIDWIEVLQKTEDIEFVPAVYTSRPELSGELKVGETITCDPKLTDGITDVRYFWYADGYPLTYGPDNSYTLTEADMGKAIRCRVKAVGAVDRPEAWSTILQ
ncbi:hypothetical protein P3T73_12545 [Kiritimatiellota bacterium B12222]|nr:hypothetical protein P3T73_12545 [Kiritimatiellota bacterium B12222]